MTEDISSSPQGNLPNETHLNNPQLPQNQSNSAKSSHGRWTKEEHHRFIEGIKHFGKNWRKVEEFIGTRTGAQIRSHAQKHFNRIMKLGNFECTDAQREFPKKSEDLIDEEQEQAAQESKNFSAQSEHVTQTENGSEQPSKPHGNQQLQQQQQQQMYQQHQKKQRDQQEQHGNLSNANNSSNNQKHQPSATSMHLGMKIENEISNSESQEISKKKRDWSKILNEQEKLRELEQKITNKKETKSAQKQELKDLSAQLKDNSNYKAFLAENLENNSKKQQFYNHLDISDNKLSPSDFINQALLAMIFEPADIQAHLLSFYVAQANLQSLVQPIEGGTQAIKKKLKPSRNGPHAEMELRSLNSSHSTALSAEEQQLNFGQNVNQLSTLRTQPLKPSPLRQSTQTNPKSAQINQASTKRAEIAQNIFKNQTSLQSKKIDNNNNFQQLSQSSTPATSSQLSDSELIHLFSQFIGGEHQPANQPIKMSQEFAQTSQLSPADKLFCSPEATYPQAHNFGNIPNCNINNDLPVDSLPYDVLCNTLLAAITSQFESPN